MTKTDRLNGGAVPRYLAILVAAVLALTLMPAAALADHNPDNVDPCEGAPVANEYVDREEARDVHERSIDCVIFRSIAVGSSNEQGQQVYNPLSPVRRDQMASFIAQTLDAGGYGEQLSEGNTDRFNDISGNVHKRNINRLADAGIVRGTGGGRYSPAQRVSRQQMASFIVQAARFAVGDQHPITRQGADQFVDVSERNVHKDNIEAGADTNPPLFRGETATTFAPGKNVLRDQMATFLVNLLRFIFDPDRAPGPQVRLIIEDRTVARGEPITGEILNARSATVTGDCIENGDVTDTDANEDGIQFSIATNRNADLGDCTLTFTITDNDGDQVTRTATITIEGAAGAQTVTDRPELVSVEFVETNATGNNVGTTFRFCFDEAITGATPDATDFRVYDDEGNPIAPGAAGQATIETNGTCVLVRFETLTTQAQVDDLTLAAVNEGAVFAQDNGETNAIGDRPLGDDRQNTVGEAGITDAPDLQAVEGFRSPTTDDQNTNFDERQFTFVTFRFDETAFTVNTQGFHLVTLDNEQIDCIAADNQAGGDPNEGANPPEQGDNTIEVRCPETQFGGNFTADQIARGFVDAGTVSDNNPDTNAVEGDNALNPLQATQTPDAATDAPDLVSATFDPSDTTRDRVTYTFDQDVFLVQNAACPDPTGAPGAPTQGFCFIVYDVDANETGGTAVTRTGARTVVVDFPEGTLADAVGASVEDGAVEAATGGNAGEDNQEDEVGVQNQQTTVTRAGRTAGPDLIDVDIVNDANGNPTVVYTFDENIVEQGALGTPGDFIAYLADGTRLVCTNAATTVGQGNPPNTADDNQVTCSAFNVDIAQGGAATNAQIRAIVLGAVEELAVTDAQGDQNPKGAEIVADEPQQQQ